MRVYRDRKQEQPLQRFKGDCWSAVQTLGEFADGMFCELPRCCLFGLHAATGIKIGIYVDYWYECAHAHLPTVWRVPSLAQKSKKGHKKIKPAVLPQSQSTFLSRLPIEIRTQILQYVLLSKVRDDKKASTITAYKTISKHYTSVGIIQYRERMHTCALLRDPWGWPLAERYLNGDLDPHPRDAPLKFRRGPLNIMLLCRQLYAESLLIRYEQGTFYLSPWDLRGPNLYYVDLAARVHERPEFAFIRTLVVPLLVVEKLHTCRKCKKLWERTWRNLSAFKGLDRLELLLLTEFATPDARINPAGLRWSDQDVQWLGKKLLSVQWVPTVVVHFSPCLRWMIPRLNLHPGQFKLENSLPDATG